MSAEVDVYAPAPGLAVGVSGAAAARAHFAAEYASALTASSDDPDLLAEIRFVRTLPPALLHDRHKTVRWAVDLSPADVRPITARIHIAGRPRRFALSLVQGFVVEPLASLAAAEASYVLLPAAALCEADTAVVVLGRSRSGKTSVVARAVVAGHGALGDDQVLVDRAGGVRPWPRRLRVYPDLRLTAPRAVAALPPRRRASLSALGWLAWASRGLVAPSLPVTWSQLGGAAVQGPVPARRVVVVERGGAGAELTIGVMPVSEAVATAGSILDEQRTRLQRVTDASWVEVLRTAHALERDMLQSGLDGLGCERWMVPDTWSAPTAVTALAERLGVRA